MKYACDEDQRSSGNKAPVWDEGRTLYVAVLNNCIIDIGTCKALMLPAVVV